MACFENYWGGIGELLDEFRGVWILRKTLSRLPKSSLRKGPPASRSPQCLAPHVIRLAPPGSPRRELPWPSPPVILDTKRSGSNASSPHERKVNRIRFERISVLLGRRAFEELELTTVILPQRVVLVLLHFKRDPGLGQSFTLQMCVASMFMTFHGPWCGLRSKPRCLSERSQQELNLLPAVWRPGHVSLSPAGRSHGRSSHPRSILRRKRKRHFVTGFGAK